MSLEHRAAELIDLDVHTTVAGAIETLLPYVGPRWRPRLAERSQFPLPPSNVDFRTAIFGGVEAAPSQAEVVVREHLDPCGIEAGLLMSLQGGALDGMTDRGEAAVLARAFNDYHIDHWLGVDPRFRLAAVVAPRDPVAAAGEIQRVAAIDGVAAVWVPLSANLLGTPHYDTILAAANDAELAVVTHPNRHYGHAIGSPLYGGGHPATDAERHVGLPTIAGGNVLSLIWEGTFERYPKLKIVFIEFGWDWLPGLLFKMDAAWKAARRAAPWLRRPPSEYVFDHVRLTWDAAEVSASPDAEQANLAMVRAERTLCFASDYPYLGSVDPTAVAAGAPAQLRRRILRENALETFGTRLVTTSAGTG